MQRGAGARGACALRCLFGRTSSILVVLWPFPFSLLPPLVCCSFFVQRLLLASGGFFVLHVSLVTLPTACYYVLLYIYICPLLPPAREIATVVMRTALSVKSDASLCGQVLFQTLVCASVASGSGRRTPVNGSTCSREHPRTQPHLLERRQRRGPPPLLRHGGVPSASGAGGQAPRGPRPGVASSHPSPRPGAAATHGSSVHPGRIPPPCRGACPVGGPPRPVRHPHDGGRARRGRARAAVGSRPRFWPTIAALRCAAAPARVVHPPASLAAGSRRGARETVPSGQPATHEAGHAVDRRGVVGPPRRGTTPRRVTAVATVATPRVGPSPPPRPGPARVGSSGAGRTAPGRGRRGPGSPAAAAGAARAPAWERWRRGGTRAVGSAEKRAAARRRRFDARDRGCEAQRRRAPRLHCRPRRGGGRPPIRTVTVLPLFETNVNANQRWSACRRPATRNAARWRV